MIKKSTLIIISAITVSVSLLTSISYASNVIIEANKQTLNSATNVTTFDGNVNVTMDNIKVKSPKAYVKMGTDGKAEKADFVNGAYAIKHDGSTLSEIKANTIQMTLLDKRVIAKGNARSMLTEDKVPVVTIKAATQEFDMKTNTIIAKGDVIINYKDIATNSSDAVININADGKPEKVNLSGNVKINEGKNIINSDNVIFNPQKNELIAIGSAKTKTTLDDGTPVLITSNNQQYNKETNTMMSSGNVKIVYKDYIATGPKAMMISENKSSKPNKIVFIGRSSINEGSRQVEANKIEITINPKNFNAEGNVKTKFVQIQTDDKQNKKKIKPKKENIDTVKNNDPNYSNVANFDKNFEKGMKNESVQSIDENAFKRSKPTLLENVMQEKQLNNQTNKE